MKIKDITEGLYDILTTPKQFAAQRDYGKQQLATQQATMKKAGDIQAAQSLKTNPARGTTPAPSATASTDIKDTLEPNPTEGSVLLVKANNGQEYFKAYTGQWFNKPNTDPANEFKAINPIKEPKDIESLNNQSGAGRIVPVKPTDAQHPNNWLLDQRRLKLANKSPAGKR